MINTRAVNDWLQQNTILPIIDHFLLITTKAELIGYSTPRDIRQFRGEAALLVKTWKEHDQDLASQYGRSVPSYKTGRDEVADVELYALTVEMRSGNAIVIAIQPCLLLVLVGANPTVHEDMQTAYHAEAKSDPRYPPEADEANGTGASSNQLSRNKITSSTENILKTESQQERGTALGQRDSSSLDLRGRPTSSTSGSGSGSLPRNFARSSHTGLEQSNGKDRSSSTAVSLSELQQGNAILSFQRTKVENMADWLRSQLSRSKFVVREE